MWKDLSFNYYQILTGFSHTPAVNSFPYPQWLQRKKEVSFWLPLVLQWNGNTDHFRLTSVEYKGASVLTWVMFSWEPHLVALLCLPLWPLMHSSQKTPEPCGQDIWVSRSPSSLRCFLNAWLSWPSVSTQKQVISLGSLLASLHPGYIPSLDRKTVTIYLFWNLFPKSWQMLLEGHTSELTTIQIGEITSVCVTFPYGCYFHSSPSHTNFFTPGITEI